VRTLIARFTAFYGGSPLHLLVTIASFALAGYVVLVMGPATLWNRQVWWQSILVWFLAAVIGHDLILFPLYALADRSLTAVFRQRGLSSPRVSPLNYIRVPTLAAGLSFLLFFPGIIKQGQFTYFAATGQTQEPFLGRWLLLVAVVYGLSALAYAVRLAFSVARSVAGRQVRPLPVREDEVVDQQGADDVDGQPDTVR
jgi:hypothetical protein